jgi:hypothetical protein
VAFVVSLSNVREGSPNMRRYRARRTHGGQIRVHLVPADAITPRTGHHAAENIPGPEASDAQIEVELDRLIED